MHNVLRSLADGSLVLDLGCGPGSFHPASFPFRTIRADLQPPRAALSVACTASRLPFRDASFDAIILNHSLEHFDDLERCLAEIGRVAAPHCALYVAVPDASTLTDRIYRWLGHGGGHVNPFCDAAQLARSISSTTGLPHRATLTLHTSLSFLNRANIGRLPRFRMLPLLNGDERFLRLLTYLLRRADQLLRTRLSVYGWALYFGAASPTPQPPATNVCIRCGSGHSSQWLVDAHSVTPRRLLPGHYLCPACGTRNLFTTDTPPSPPPPLP